MQPDTQDLLLLGRRMSSGRRVLGCRGAELLLVAVLLLVACTETKD